jgi:DNA-binding XRE family transcriptional regulator
MSTDNIKELRLSFGISQEKLAEMVEVSTRTIQRMESTGKVSKVTLNKITAAFDNYIHPQKELPKITTYKLDKTKLLNCYSNLELFLSKNKNIEIIMKSTGIIFSGLGVLGVGLGDYTSAILLLIGFVCFSFALLFNTKNKHHVALRLHVKAQKGLLKHYDHFKDKWCVINDKTVFLNDLTLLGSSVKNTGLPHLFNATEIGPSYEKVCSVMHKNNPHLKLLVTDDTRLIRVFMDREFNYVVYNSLLWPSKGCMEFETKVLNKLQLKSYLSERQPAFYKLVSAQACE